MKKQYIWIIIVITNICTALGIYYLMELKLGLYSLSTTIHRNITYTENLEILLNSIILDLKNGDETTLQKLEKMQGNLSPSYEGVDIRNLIESSGFEWREEVSRHTNKNNHS